MFFGGKVKNHKCFKVAMRVLGEIHVRSLRISLIVTIITVAFLCSGLVAALNSNEASVQAIFSTQPLQAGQTVTVRIFFTSTSADELQITNVGIHFDWMPSGGFYGYDLSSAPVTIPSGGGNYMFESIAIQVPVNVTSVSHSYYVGVDGTQGASSPFSWDSPAASIDVSGGSDNTTPTSTNSGGGQPEGQPNLLLYGAVAAVVVIVALLIIVLVVRKKRTQPRSATNQDAGQPETPSPEQKPNSEQDFTI